MLCVVAVGCPRVTSHAARSVDPVPISESDEEMDGIMTCHLETGLANASSLLILEQVLISMDTARTGMRKQNT